jgi:hypothetical protein
MSSEITLDERKATFLPATGRPKIGRAVLTSERILVFDEKWNAGIAFAVGGPIASAITEKLQQRHEAGGPLLDLPLSDVAAVERVRKGLNKDVLLVRTTAGDEHRFIGMYSDWSPLIERARTER